MNATIVRLNGRSIEETGHILTARLIELGKKAELIDADTAQRIGQAAGAAVVAQMLARNGVVVVLACPDVSELPEADVVDAEVGEFDTPDFAAEKILDTLAERDVVALESTTYTPEEEERIRRRLADLGYVE